MIWLLKSKPTHSPRNICLIFLLLLFISLLHSNMKPIKKFCVPPVSTIISYFLFCLISSLHYKSIGICPVKLLPVWYDLTQAVHRLLLFETHFLFPSDLAWFLENHILVFLLTSLVTTSYSVADSCVINGKMCVCVLSSQRVLSLP